MMTEHIIRHIYLGVAGSLRGLDAVTAIINILPDGDGRREGGARGRQGRSQKRT